MTNRSDQPPRSVRAPRRPLLVAMALSSALGGIICGWVWNPVSEAVNAERCYVSPAAFESAELIEVVASAGLANAWFNAPQAVRDRVALEMEGARSLAKDLVCERFRLLAEPQQAPFSAAAVFEVCEEVVRRRGISAGNWRDASQLNMAIDDVRKSFGVLLADQIGSVP